MLIRTTFYKAIGIAFIIALLFAPVPADNLWWREALNSGHTLLFIYFSFVIHSQISVKMHLLNTFVLYLLVLVIGMLLGVIIEVLQSLGQREASFDDLYKNFWGIMTGLCLISLQKVNVLRYQKVFRVTILMMAAVFLLSGLGSVLTLSWHYIERHRAFPVIIDPGANWASSFVRFNNARIIEVSALSQKDKVPAHIIQFDSGDYPGISIIEPEADWSNYRYLRLKIYSMNKAAHYLNLRVHDYLHNQSHQDRFNKKLYIRPGINTFRISLNQIRLSPANRELNLKNIAGLILFSENLKKPLQFSVSRIALE